MDPVGGEPGFSLTLPAPPFSPWLRLAHRWAVEPALVAAHAPLRRLKDFEFFLVTEGSSWLHVPLAGGHIPLPRGHLALIPPGLVHAWGHLPGAHLAVHADLHARPALESPAQIDYLGDPVVAGAARPAWRWTLTLGHERLDLPLAVAVDRAAWERRLAPLCELWSHRAHAGAAGRLAAAGILGEAFAAFLAQARGDHGDPIAAVLAEAAAGPPAHARVALLARRAGMGDEAFRAAVQARFGRGPREQVERLRLERAAYALRSTDLPVAAVGEAAGYADPFHFARVFRRVYGASPRDYRRG